MEGEISELSFGVLFFFLNGRRDHGTDEASRALIWGSLFLLSMRDVSW
jgi:hypothetical protein